MVHRVASSGDSRVALMTDDFAQIRYNTYSYNIQQQEEQGVISIHKAAASTSTRVLCPVVSYPVLKQKQEQEQPFFIVYVLPSTAVS